MDEPGEDAVLREPAVGVQVVPLLGPEQACERLAQDAGLVGAERGRRDGAIKLVGLRPARTQGAVEAHKGIGCRLGRGVGEPEP